MGIVGADKAAVLSEIGNNEPESGDADGGPALSIFGLSASNARSPFSVRPAQHLCEVVEHLNGRSELSVSRTDPDSIGSVDVSDELDLEDAKGREHAKRGLEVAAAGITTC